MRPAALLLPLLLTSLPATAATRTYALIIANNRSLDPGVGPLRYADDDGARNFELFSLFADRAALFAVLDGETARLHPEAARRAEVPERQAILDRLRAWNREMAADLARGDEPELYLLYAGHGDVDGSGMGYVWLHDRRLTRGELFRDLIAPSAARFVHLVVDACKSYFLVRARGGTPAWRDDRAPEGDAALGQLLAGESLEGHPRVGVIVATSGDQETHEWSRWRGGILSHELRSAFAGAADVNGDGRVEYSEVRAFIAAANARLVSAQARLEVYARPPAADRRRPLADLRRALAHEAALLRFGAVDHGRYHLEDERGVRFADLHKEAGSAFDLALAPRRSYWLRRDDGDEAELRGGPGRRIAVTELRFQRRTLAARGAVEESFRRQLYATAFGRGFYDGFVATSGDLPVDPQGEALVVAAAPRSRRHGLAAGYVLSGGPLAIPAPFHGADLRYAYRATGWLDLGLAAQAARGAGGGQEAWRVALLATVAAEWRPAEVLGLRFELAAGWQLAGGTVHLPGTGLVAGLDPAGVRGEIGGGATYQPWPWLGLQLRGGLAVDLSTLTLDGPTRYRDTIVNASPFVALSLLTRL